MSLRLKAALLALVAGALAGTRADAHDLPNQIVVQAFVEAGSEETELVLRVPLVLLQGIGLPTRGAGFIDFEAAEDEFRRAAVALADQLRLVIEGAPAAPERYAYRVSLPDEQVFETFERARGHVLGPDLPAASDVMVDHGYFDVYFAYPPVPDGIEPVLDVALGSGYGAYLQLVLRYTAAGGEELAYRVHGDHGLLVLEPGFWSAALTFARSGVEHILSGVDHLLFLLCLVLPFRLRDIRSLIAVVTAFTVAHSVTLIMTALGHAPSGTWFAPAIETMIAVSILYMAIENAIVAWRGGSRLLRLRWLITGVFGLIHGFGFAFVLSDELQFAGGHLLASLLAFNVGVELGQIGVLLVLMPLLELARRLDPDARIVMVLGSVLVGHTAWHWMLERIEVLREAGPFEIAWAGIRPLAAIALILVGVCLLASRYVKTRSTALGGD